MSYPIDIRLGSKNGYHTPAEAQRYYGKYARNGITWHWWGGGQGASAHDGLVNYFLGQMIQGNKSVNYILSDNKISLLVNPDNVAWTSQNGNPTTISVECQPTLSAEGYKKAGWLIWQLEQRYSKGLAHYPHNYWFPTQCPGTISIDRMKQEYNRWKSGYYNPQPAPPAPAPPQPAPPKKAELIWTKWKEGQIQYVVNKQPTNLWNFDNTTWNMQSVKQFNKGEQVTIVGEVLNKTLNAKYLLTQYSFDKKIPNGFNAKDLDVYVAPRPVPVPPTPEPEVPPPYDPEWKQKLRDIDDTPYWFIKDQELIDITTGKPTGTLKFAKNDKFVCSALTVSNGVEYRITDYSFKKGIFNGVPTSSLTLTAPGEPNIPPVPSEPSVEEQVNWLMKAVKAILAYLKINV